MQPNQLLIDGFDRIQHVVRHVLNGADQALLTYRPDDDANSIAWLVWHLTRVMDDHVADAYEREQIWTAGGWADRFALPFDAYATGYGQSPDEVAQVDIEADLLISYHEGVQERVHEVLALTRAEDLDRVVDTNWDPPVTLAVRLVSVVSDCLQHAGQAAYVRGLAERRS